MRPPKEHNVTESSNLFSDREFSRRGYKKLISVFLKHNYEISSFHDIQPNKPNLILRHDVDFCTSCAVGLAEIEASLGVKSHYYVLLTTEFYNLSSSNNLQNMKRIIQLGHEVGLHFDASLYENNLNLLDKAAKRECNILENILNISVKSISFHRPAKSLIGYDKKIAGRIHTYQKLFFSQISYISDSGGAFKYGHPFDNDAFKEKKAIQLLTHPIWWPASPVENNLNLLSTFLDERALNLEGFARANCKPFDDLYTK